MAKPKIQQLTPAQVEELGAFREKWLAIGRSTERADRPRAEAAFAGVYERIGEPPPKVIWFEGPWSAMIGRAVLQKLSEPEAASVAVEPLLYRDAVIPMQAAVSATISAALEAAAISSLIIAPRRALQPEQAERHRGVLAALSEALLDPTRPFADQHTLDAALYNSLYAVFGEQLPRMPADQMGPLSDEIKREVGPDVWQVLARAIGNQFFDLRHSLFLALREGFVTPTISSLMRATHERIGLPLDWQLRFSPADGLPVMLWRTLGDALEDALKEAPDTVPEVPLSGIWDFERRTRMWFDAVRLLRQVARIDGFGESVKSEIMALLGVTTYDTIWSALGWEVEVQILEDFEALHRTRVDIGMSLRDAIEHITVWDPDRSPVLALNTALEDISSTAYLQMVDGFLAPIRERVLMSLDDPLHQAVASAISIGRHLAYGKPAILALYHAQDDAWMQLIHSLDRSLTGAIHDLMASTPYAAAVRQAGWWDATAGIELAMQVQTQWFLAQRLTRAMVEVLHALPEAPMRSRMRESLDHAWWGQHDSWWAFYKFANEVLGVEYEPDHARDLDLWLELAQSCGWWFPYRGVVLACERPCVQAVDAQGRLHAVDGPAMAFADGFRIYALHGIRVPEHAIMDPDTLTVEEIHAERNVETRRILVQVMGQERYLREANAEVIHRDDWGVLYRADRPGDTPLVMVKVVNSSPEPDGSYRDYFLRVDPQLRPMLPGGRFGEPQLLTALNAVASTFGLTGKEYVLAQQT